MQVFKDGASVNHTELSMRRVTVEYVLDVLSVVTVGGAHSRGGLDYGKWCPRGRKGGVLRTLSSCNSGTAVKSLCQ